MKISRILKPEYLKRIILPSFPLGLLFFLTPLAYRKGILGDSPFAKSWIFYVCALVLALTLLVQSLLEKDDFKREYNDRELILFPWPLLLFLVFITWMVITALLGLRPEISIGRAIDFMAKGAISVLVFSQARRFSLIKTCLWISAALFLVSVLAVAQHFGIAPDYWYQRKPPAATFVNANHLAYYIGLALPFPGLLLVWARGKKLAVLAGIFLCLATSCAFYTRTRGLWVALSGSFVYLLLLCWILIKKRPGIYFNLPLISRFKAIILVAAVAAGLGAAFLPGNIDSTPIMERVVSIKDTSHITNNFRLAVWQNTLEIIKDYPVTGVGANGFQFIYPAYSNKIVPTPTFSPTLQVFEAHNDYLQYATEMGIPGGLMFLLLAAAVPVLTVAEINRRGRLRRKEFGLIFFSVSLINVLGHAFFDFTTLSAGSGNLIWPVWALWLSLIYPQSDKNGKNGNKWTFCLVPAIKKKFSGIIIVVSIVIIAGMCLISTGRIIGGRQLLESVRLFNGSKMYGRMFCARIESKIEQANANMPFYAAAQRYRAEFYAFCHSPSPGSRARMEQFLLEDPYNTELWLNLVPFRIEAGDFAGSHALLDKFLKIFPQSAEAIALRGYLYQVSGDLEKSDFFYAKALKIEPKVYAEIAKFRDKRKAPR